MKLFHFLFSCCRRSFLKMCNSPEAFLSLRSHFISSHALLCVSHWVLGIGDRHLSNFMLNMETGGMIGIDFGHAFGSATQVSRNLCAAKLQCGSFRKGIISSMGFSLCPPSSSQCQSSCLSGWPNSLWISCSHWRSRVWSRASWSTRSERTELSRIFYLTPWTCSSRSRHWTGR